LHPTGFAQVSNEKLEKQNGTITLVKWARVEGIAQVGSEPGNKLIPSINPHEYNILNGTRASFDDRATCDENGKFVFENLPPGKAQVSIGIALEIPADEHREASIGNAFHRRKDVELVSGETTSVHLCHVVRPIIGKLVVPDDYEGRPNWNNCEIHCRLSVKDQPNFRKEWEEIEKLRPEDLVGDVVRESQWFETEIGKKYCELHRALGETRDEFNRRQYEYYLSCVIDSDGTFRIEHVPAEDWTLTVKLVVPPPYPPGTQREIANLEHEFRVPEIHGDQFDEPLDLGTLTLELCPRPISVGMTAPDFETVRFEPFSDDEKIKESDEKLPCDLFQFTNGDCQPFV